MAADTDNRTSEQISLTRFLRERLRLRQDSEHEQAFVRVVIFLILDIPALVWLLVWLGSQFFLNQEGVAWTAHVGGFIFGTFVGIGARAAGTVSWPPPDPVRS